jgi:NADPH2:quinone reductase
VRAQVLHDITGPSALKLEEIDAPPAPDGTTAIEVHAAGMGFVDFLVTHGQYQVRPPLPFVPGIEVAGITDGRRVAATVPVGAFAEVAVTVDFLVFDIPDDLPFATAAAMVTNYQTAHLALLKRGRLQPGETVLVLGGAGGVGLACIAVAKAAGAGRVVAVVSTAERGELATAAGADAICLTDDEQWEQADIVVDPVGGDAFKRGLRSLNPHGRLLVIGFASGTIPEVAVNRLLLKSTDVVGVNYGGSLMFDQQFAQAAWADLMGWWSAGKLRVDGVSEHPLEDVPDVLEGLGARQVTGKPVAVLR